MSPFVFDSLRPAILRFLAFFVLVLCMGYAVQAQSGIALVQHAGKDGGTTTTTSLAFTSSNTAGNWIAVCARGGFSSSQIFTVSDSNGNLYRRAAQIGFNGSAVTLAIFYAENIYAGANTITVSDTVSAPLRIAILEFSGVATSNSLDAAVAGTGTGTSPATPNLTTTSNGDLLLASFATTNPASFTAGSGYTISDFVPAEPNTKLVAEQQIQPTAGAASAGASLSSSDSWGAVLAAVRAAGEGTGSAPPTISSLSPTSGSAGTSVTITGTNFGSTQGGSSVQFNGMSAAPTSWSDTTIVAPVPNGATSGNVVVSVGGVASNGISFTVTITAVGPSITAQPANQTATAGQTATFTVTASGTAPLSYQWQKSGANISGATSSSYTTAATTTSDNGSTFDVIVSNSAGSVASNAATLTVNAAAVAPTITAQPTNQTVTAGQAATFSVTASGTAPLRYQWQKNGANISGAISSAHTTPATTTSDNGSAFSVVVTNSAGSVTSNAATLTVNASAVTPTIATQPANQTVTAGQTATFTVSASGTAPLSYQWQKNGADIAGATSSTYTTPATSTSDNGSTFDVVVSNTAGSATSTAATLSVNSNSTSQAGWTWIQDNPLVFCVAPANGCSIATGENAATTPGTVWVLQVQTQNNVTMTNVTGGGGTWVHCPNCHVTNPSGFNADAWYNLSGNAGTTSGISFTLSGSSGNVFSVNFFELLPPPGSTASFDASATATPLSCTTCNGPTLVLAATDAVIMNPGGAPAAGWNACAAPYVTDSNGSCIGLNVTAGSTTPAVTFTKASNPEFLAIAFKSTAGNFTPPPHQYSLVNFTAASPGNCSPTCTITLSAPTSGSGHLLFVEAGDETNAHITSVNGGGTWAIPSGPNTCQINFNISGLANANSCAYNLSAAPGISSLVVTMSGNTVANFAVWEVSTTTGSFVFDTQASTINNNTSFYNSGPPLTLSGQNDVVFQSEWCVGGSAGPTYYALPHIARSGTVGPFNYFLDTETSSVVLLDSGPTAPTPVWTNPQHNPTFVSAVAFKAQ